MTTTLSGSVSVTLIKNSTSTITPTDYAMTTLDALRSSVFSAAERMMAEKDDIKILTL